VADRRPTAATTIAAVIGHPVRHSRSPAIANAAFASAGVDWTFVAFDVAPGGGADAVRAMRTLGLGGLMVTMPHKVDVVEALDDLTPAAAALGAVNSVAWVGDRLVGDNTDGAGLVAALAADGIGIEGRRCAVLGAGGAARSIAWALAEAGAAEVVVVNRTAERAAEAALLAGSVGRVGTVADVAAVDIVVNATSVGMGAPEGAAGPMPVPADVLHGGHVVVDAVYQPLETPLLRSARAAGAIVVDGLGMLVHQAARSIRRWIDLEPDLHAMSVAAARGEERRPRPTE
jgi:shikimate dehydrogenase